MTIATNMITNTRQPMPSATKSALSELGSAGGSGLGAGPDGRSAGGSVIGAGTYHAPRDWLCAADAVFALALGAIERAVGGFQQLLGLVHRVLVGGHAHAHRDVLVRVER